MVCQSLQSDDTCVVCQSLQGDKTCWCVRLYRGDDQVGDFQNSLHSPSMTGNGKSDSNIKFSTRVSLLQLTRH